MKGMLFFCFFKVSKNHFCLFIFLCLFSTLLQPAASSSSDISKLLNERQEMYKEAIQNAKAEGASSKIRRFERGLKVHYK